MSPPPAPGVILHVPSVSLLIRKTSGEVAGMKKQENRGNTKLENPRKTKQRCKENNKRGSKNCWGNAF
jgi:hypothetical protein